MDPIKTYTVGVNHLTGLEALAFARMPQEQIAALVKMQLSDMAQWTVSSYTTGGTSMYAETFSMPGQELYVIELDPAAVEEAKQLIQEVFNNIGKRDYVYYNLNCKLS